MFACCSFRSIFTRFWPYVLIGALFFGALNWRGPYLLLAGDSAQYLEFAKAIRSGEVFSSQEPKAYALYLRTPGFPLLLAVGELLTGGDRRDALRLVHASLGLIAVFAVMYLLRTQIHPLISGLSVICALAQAQEVNLAVMTEWLTLSYLLILYATWAAFFTERKLKWLVWGAVICSLMVLTRPVFLYLLPLPFAMALLFLRRQPGPTLRRALAALALGCAPVALWAAFNFYRLGLFTVSPAGVVSLFGVASALGPASAQAGDDLAFQVFVREANRMRSILDSLAGVPGGPTQEQIYSVVADNTSLAWMLKEQLQLSWKDTTHYLARYSHRVIIDRGRTYLMYVWQGVTGLYSLLPLLVPMLLFPFYLWWRRVSLPLAYAAIMFLALHVSYAVLIAVVGVMHGRYYNLTFIPLHSVALITGAAYVCSIFGIGAKDSV